MNYILDGVMILIFLLSVLIGSKRGFIKTLSGVIAFAAALAVAMLLSGPVSAFLYDTLVAPSILSTMEEQLTGVSTAAQSVSDALASLPPLVQNLLAQSGVTDADTLMSSMSVGADGSLVQSIADVVRTAVLPLVEAICSLLLFLITRIVAGILLRGVDLVAKLPLLKQVNKALGAVAGVVSGVLWVLFAVSVVQVAAALGTADSTINTAVLGDTLLTNWLVTVNPLGSALREAVAVVAK